MLKNKSIRVVSWIKTKEMFIIVGNIAGISRIDFFMNQNTSVFLHFFLSAVHQYMSEL